ncbi:Protein kinase domain-containing protein [Heracleum sosnowskyi]|uniref:Protein kinase domain-containing protein n=1 Tax=Heracleum sosnowskyi TaxID=360622 RepID=A0AAD8IDP3_9APIA|nr:Protein kinase domain-containing protein [Heracleum sosnowskyi]
MCKSSKKKMLAAVISPKRHSNSHNLQSSSVNPSTSHNFSGETYSSGGSSYNIKDSYQSSVSSKGSLASLRESLPSEHAHVFDFSEISSATNRFRSTQFSKSSSSTAWRCRLRGKDVIIFQRKLRRKIDSDKLIQRIQIATDIAHGLDYIHHSTGFNQCFVHNHIKSSSIIVTEPDLNAKICHFGTSELCGEIVDVEEEEARCSDLKRSDSRVMKFEGTRGYMSPEFQTTGVPTQKCDVFAFGVVILELLSGAEPLKYSYGSDGGYVRVSLIETAREAVDGGVGALRRWMDKRLKDSYPVEVADKLTKIGLECVEEDLNKRPEMGWVAGRISKLFLESLTWSEKMGIPVDFTASFAPR